MTGESQNKIAIELTEHDARMFMEFQKHYDMFSLLQESNIFDTVAGSIVLHFNINGQIAKIDRNQILFVLQK